VVCVGDAIAGTVLADPDRGITRSCAVNAGCAIWSRLFSSRAGDTADAVGSLLVGGAAVAERGVCPEEAGLAGVTRVLDAVLYFGRLAGKRPRFVVEARVADLEATW
jgi:hypothetical protein